MMEATKNYLKGQKQFKKNALHLEYLSQTSYLKLRVPQKAGNCLSRQCNGRHEAFFNLTVQQDEKHLKELTSLKGIFILTAFGKKSMRRVRSKLKLASKPTVVHVV